MPFKCFTTEQPMGHLNITLSWPTVMHKSISGVAAHAHRTKHADSASYLQGFLVKLSFRFQQDHEKTCGKQAMDFT